MNKVTIQLFRDVGKTNIGAFQQTVTDNPGACGTVSSGMQNIDMGDIDLLGTLTVPGRDPKHPNTTKWGALMHEITEVYASTSLELVYKDAHNIAIDFENLTYNMEGTGTVRKKDAPMMAPVSRPGGGYTIFEPVFDDVFGSGYWSFDWDVVGGFGTQTPLQWGYFGQQSIPDDGLFFGGSEIRLTGIGFVAVPEPDSFAMLFSSGVLAIGAIRRRRRKSLMLRKAGGRS